MVNQKRLAIFEIVQEKGTEFIFWITTIINPWICFVRMFTRCLGEQCMFLPVFREAIKYCNDLEKHNKAREVFLKTHLRNLVSTQYIILSFIVILADIAFNDEQNDVLSLSNFTNFLYSDWFCLSRRRSCANRLTKADNYRSKRTLEIQSLIPVVKILSE